MRQDFKLILVSFLLFNLATSCSSYDQVIVQEVEDGITARRFASDSVGRQVLHITSKKPQPKQDVSYAWYRNRRVNKNVGNYGGLLLHGSFEQYDQEKHLIEKGIFKKGKRMGRWTYWYSSGAKKMETSFHKSGKLQGRYTFFNSDGTLIERGYHKNGTKVKKWLTYHPNGVLAISEKFCGKGERKGRYTAYSTEGEVIEKGRFKKGEKHGKWIEDSEVIYYRRGSTVKKSERFKWFKRLWAKKQTQKPSRRSKQHRTTTNEQESALNEEPRQARKGKRRTRKKRDSITRDSITKG